MGDRYGWALTFICGIGTVFWLLFELKLTYIREDLLKKAKIRTGRESRFVTDHDDTSSGLAALACGSCYFAKHDSLKECMEKDRTAAAAAKGVVAGKAAAPAPAAACVELEGDTQDECCKHVPAGRLMGDSACGEDLVPGSRSGSRTTAQGSAKNASSTTPAP
jgi:hypothetical protein